LLTRSLPDLQSRLARDPAWSVYALGDLAPGLFEHAEWRIEAAGEPAVLLLYRQFEVPVLFTFGPPAAVAPLLGDIAREPACYLSIRPEILPLVEARFRVTTLTPMWRMTLAAASFLPVAAPNLPPPVRLGLEHLPALETLFADGALSGEAPDFFSPAMLAHGIFYGLFEGAALVAAAGTHLIAPEQGVAAIGNVYTRRDRRGRGLAALVTARVAADLLAYAPPLTVIALNVSQANRAAQRVYQRLGFRRYCAFYEGLAHAIHRHPPPHGS
jgi:ribosomal protein S18 acetylase RimI-like enzyme